MEMSILTFFKPTRKLSTAKNTGLSEYVSHEANKGVESALQKESEVATPGSASLVSLLYFTHLTMRTMKIHVSVSLRTSSCHTSQKFEKN